ncbi:hypothetical protein D3C80_1908260 [compost metagenome]
MYLGRISFLERVLQINTIFRFLLVQKIQEISHLLVIWTKMVFLLIQILKDLALEIILMVNQKMRSLLMLQI